MRSDGSLDQVVVVEMERRTPQVPPALQAHFLTRPCHQSVLTNLQYMEACPHFRALLESPLPGSLLQVRPVSVVFQRLCMSSALPILTPDASLGLGCSASSPGDACISLVVLLSPAVRLENLWLDDLITGTAHYEIEVVMCWVMAK